MCGTLSPCLTRFVFCKSPALLGAARRASGVGWRRMLSLAEKRESAARGIQALHLIVPVEGICGVFENFIFKTAWKGRSKGEEGMGCRGGERRRGEKKREGVGCGTVRTVCARQQNLQRWARGLDPRGLDAQAHSSLCTSLNSCATAEPSLAQSALASTARAGAAVCGGYRGVYDGGDGTSIPQRPPPGRAGSEQMDDSKLVIGIAIFEFNHRPACRMEYPTAEASQRRAKVAVSDGRERADADIEQGVNGRFHDRLAEAQSITLSALRAMVVVLYCGRRRAFEELLNQDWVLGAEIRPGVYRPIYFRRS
ncbi:hypothetical protein B0H16DRAFT_1481345 [Mycena metata]|uniref:Uncharacterized protein n=1 Tax=Mycena metata TaxID=1033252 RepID=A0AAD7MAU3_9AGAR|nr:hypothetical protein B0H16DRAFT_1481345 [Mycena metata]